MNIVYSIISIITVMLAMWVVSLFYQNIAKLIKIPINAIFLLWVILIGMLSFQLLPAILRLFSNWKYEYAVNILPEEVMFVYVIEMFSVFIWAAVTFAVITWAKTGALTAPNGLEYPSLGKLYKRSLNYGRQYKDLLKKESNRSSLPKILVLMFLFGSSVVNFFSIYNSDVTIFLGWMLRPVLTRGGFALAVIVVIIGRSYFRGLWYYPAIGLSVLIILPSLVSGSHGAIVSVALYLFFSIIFINKNRLILISVIMGLIVVVLFNEQLHSMRAIYRSAQNVTIEERIETLLAVTVDDDDKSFAEKIEWRFGENSRVSVGYLRMTAEGNQPGLQQIINSFYSILPRSIYPDKPYSGSADGSKYGGGMFQIHNEIYGQPKNMSGFFTSMQAYWEGGLAFVLIASVIAGLYTAFILLTADKLGGLGFSLVLLHIDTWWQMPKLWLSEIVLQSITYILIYTLFIFCVNYSRRFRINKTRINSLA